MYVVHVLKFLLSWFIEILKHLWYFRYKVGRALAKGAAIMGRVMARWIAHPYADSIHLASMAKFVKVFEVWSLLIFKEIIINSDHIGERSLFSRQLLGRWHLRFSFVCCFKIGHLRFSFVCCFKIVIQRSQQWFYFYF